MNYQERKLIESDLWDCKTVGDIFNYLSNYFDLFSKPIPVIYKPIIISGLLSAIGWIAPDKKSKSKVNLKADGNL
jgi:hypothetical protein